jgi:3-keto-5-aminohexanoate cleavage enzyme
VALNGNRDQAENPAIPLTPHDVAREAARCFDAGATVAHVHARTIEGEWSLDPGWYAEAIRLIRQDTPGMLVSITSIRPAGFSAGTVIDTLDALAADGTSRPDLVSINLGHISTWDAQTGRTWHYPNDFDDVSRLLFRCSDLGIVPELGVMDLGFINNAVVLRDAGLLPKKPWFLLELDSPGYGQGPQVAPSTPENYDMLSSVLSEQFPGSRWAAHGNGTATYAVLERALATGAHIRIGYEDVVTLPKGEVAASNADLLGWVVDVAARFDRTPATREQTTRIVGI